MRKLEGRVALVTGAARGIGLSIVERLVAEGASVVVADIDHEPLVSMRQRIEQAGGQIAEYAGDVTDGEFAKSFLNLALDRFGDIHILINNAGYVWNGPVHAMTNEQWRAMHDVHLNAPFYLLREFGRFLETRASQASDSGSAAHRKVVNISSIAATGGSSGHAAYSAAKSGLHGLTKTLAKEWGKWRVNVNCVAFGYIETRLTQERQGDSFVTIKGNDYPAGLTRGAIDSITKRIALGRAGTSAEAAGGVLLLCFPESDYITGQVIEVSGGMVN